MYMFVCPYVHVCADILPTTSPNAGGSCIDVPTAVAAWKKYMNPLSTLNPKVYLGSPAVTNAAPSGTTGLGWLAKFLEQCNGCQIDHVNVHWYVTNSV